MKLQICNALENMIAARVKKQSTTILFTVELWNFEGFKRAGLEKEPGPKLYRGRALRAGSFFF